MRKWILTVAAALCMTAVCSTYIVMAPEGFALPATVGYPVGAFAVAATGFMFLRWIRKVRSATRL